MRSLFKARTGLESLSHVIDPLLILDISLSSYSPRLKSLPLLCLRLPPGFLIDYLLALASPNLSNNHLVSFFTI